MILFCDRPYNERMRLRGIVESHGCHVDGYSGSGMGVSFSRDGFARAMVAMRLEGFEVVGLHYFPLGSDNPEPELRHTNPRYGGEPGSWLRGAFVPEVAA